MRDEGKKLIVESYHWVGAIMKQQLSGLKPVQLTELEAEFEKVESEAGRAKPERYLKSQRPAVPSGFGGAAGEEGVGDHGDGGDGQVEEEALDPYDLMDPVDITSKLPKNFYELVAEKKWQLRKEALVCNSKEFFLITYIHILINNVIPLVLIHFHPPSYRFVAGCGLALDADAQNCAQPRPQ